MAIHTLYANITPEQRKYWKVAPDFSYSEIEKQPWFLSSSGHIEGTYYSVFNVKNATKLK